MTDFTGKTILLGVPTHYHLDQVIEQELRYQGFNVVNISFFGQPYRYRHIGERLTCFAMKNIAGQRFYKNTLTYRQYQQAIATKLMDTLKVDYVLIIRPDVYPISFIAALKEKYGRLVGYQWDGLDKFPNIYPYITMFDRFFVFDPRDLRTAGVLPITNFYPMSYGNLTDRSIQSDVFYVGSYHKHRINKLSLIVEECKALGADVRLQLSSSKRRYSPLPLAEGSMPYAQNLRHVFNTNALIDIVGSAHFGLSFRTFESIGFEKKLITTNAKVRDYDFYHPDNILVWDDQPTTTMRLFFETPYRQLDHRVREKYGFGNWIRYVLGVDNHEPITLPR